MNTGKNNKKFQTFIKVVTNSYSQVFFSDNKVFAVILLGVSFIDLFAGICGLFSVLVTAVAAKWFGLNIEQTKKGIYGFNSLLTGLGLGIYFAPGWLLFLILVLAAIFTLFLSVAMEGVIGKYALPYLSIPFILSFWTVTLATREFAALGISERGIYSLNDLYILGGDRLVQIYEWWNSIVIPPSLKTYFISLGAIFFQFNVLSGIIIAFGLLYYSRIAFSLSLLGFYSAFYFYQLIGADLTVFNYSYIGFNFILTAIAIGGFFIIPSKLSYLWTVLLMPLVVILVVSLNKIFMAFALPIYSLPFNIIVLLFLYVLKFRVSNYQHLSEVVIQQNSPEKNLYSYQNYLARFRQKTPVSIKLPFYGEWMVTQGHDGEFTHQGLWKHAWDFMIVDEDTKTYTDKGDYPEDYYCYGKAVTAPADGIVEEVVDNVPDNIIGEVDVKNNWGNTIIIQHNDSLFSKLSHLVPGSITVKKGESIKTGQIIGKCGNSGRSPYPHLHFQLQTMPYIGSRTLDYPIGHYILKKDTGIELYSYNKPLKGEMVSNIIKTPLLQKAFNFIPGKNLKWEKPDSDIIYEWEIRTNPYNQLYIECTDTHSRIYFEEDDDMLIFTHFTGNKSSVLYYFYLAAYKLQKGFYNGLKMKDNYPINHIFSKKALFFHDFVAPFYKYLYAGYEINYSEIDNELSPSFIKLNSTATKYYRKKLLSKTEFEIRINTEGIESLRMNDNNRETLFLCVK